MEMCSLHLNALPGIKNYTSVKLVKKGWTKLEHFQQQLDIVCSLKWIQPQHNLMEF